MTESPDGVLDALFDGKEAARPLYDFVRAQLELLGEDVVVEPGAAYVAFRRRRQFAVVRPASDTRVELGLALPEAGPTSRFAEAGPLGAANITHRVSVVSEADVDGELLVWLRAAYDAAG